MQKSPSTKRSHRYNTYRRTRIANAIASTLLALAIAPSAIASNADAHDRINAIITAALDSSNKSSAPTIKQSLSPLYGFSRHWQKATDNEKSTSNESSLPITSLAGLSGDASSWISEEFQADWGLEAINAHHAYARGLTGNGIRLGLVDTGTGFDHTEFAGKNHLSLTMAELLADGTHCADNSILAGPDACFFSRGHEVAITGDYFDPELANYFPDPSNNHLWGKTFFSFNSHGTHVAGTMAANRDGNGMHGVAFGADLSSARLFNDSMTHVDAGCFFLNICDTYRTSADSTAFDYMYEQAIAQNVRAMNHSWGYTYITYTPDDVENAHRDILGTPSIYTRLESMADASRESGMIQVVSAGNNSGISASPETSPQPTAPATIPMFFQDVEQYWVSVVNLSENLELSNRSMKCGVTANWCIAAPGSNVTSTVFDGDENIAGDWLIDANGNIRYDIENRDGIPGFADYSGTSMAAPHVTGALGLLFERFPYLNGAQVRDVMLTTATDLGEEGVDDVYGWGLLNLQKAIEGYGQLRVDTEVVMDTTAGGLKVWEGDAWDDWTNDIGGPGHLTKSGAGWLRLSGDNTFGGASITQGLLEFDGANTLAGNVNVQGGTLLLNGSLDGSDLRVSGGLAVINGTVTGGITRIESEGTLGGSGTLGDTWVDGTIAPGNSIGTLSIGGNYLQTENATFAAELSPPDLADLLQVSGNASLLGGTLLAIRSPGTYLLGQQYRIISALGGVDGEFDNIDSTMISPFLSLSLHYSANAVDIAVSRGQSLASASRTLNQLSTAAALDLLGDDQGLLMPLTQLNESQARNAFELLSGEIHASAQQILLDNSRLVRDTAIARAASAQDAFRNQRDAGADTGAWVEIQRQGGSIATDANASRAEYAGNAILVGADHQLDSGWLFGAYGGTGRTDFDVRQRTSEGDANNLHMGVYAGKAWGNFATRAGYTHSNHELKIERDVAFAGYSDSLGSRYDANTSQAYIDAGYRFGNENWGVEPYLQYAHVKLDSDNFNEAGGAATLQGRSADARVDLSMAGVRFNANLRGSRQEQTWLSLRGSLGYRHAGGDQVRLTEASFDGSNWFGIRSPAITGEAVVAEVGVAARTSRNSLLEFGYSGVHGDEARNHGLNARFSVQF